MERLPGQHKERLSKLKRRQQLHWCDSGLWGWSAGGGTQGDLGSFKSFLPEALVQKQSSSSTNIHERGEIWWSCGHCGLFFYLGEANVFQDNLDSFLAIAEELQLKGLVGKTDEKVDDYIADRKPLLPTPEPAINTLSKISTNPAFSGQKKNYQSHKRAEESKVLALPTYFSGDLEELEERVKSMMEKSQNKLPDGRKADVCKVCGKEDKTTNIKDHIEANHLEGIAIPCNLCNKTFRSRNGLRRHKCFDG